MSAKHPVIAVTGSSGAGTTTTSLAFRKIFAQLNLHAAEVEGDSFHRYTRPEMDMAIRKARDQGKHISYFGPEANDFGLLEHTFAEYGQSGKGQSRKYLHTYDEAVPWNQVPGTFTPWQPLPEPTDVLFYEGLHGGVVTPQHNVANHVDLLGRQLNYFLTCPLSLFNLSMNFRPSLSRRIQCPSSMYKPLKE